MALIVETQGKVVTVTLDFPPVNALRLADYQAIADAFDAISRRDDVHCAVLAARGEKAFCAGLDLNEFKAATVDEDPERARIVHATFEVVQTCAIPVIAAVSGPALGAGCALAANCDIRIASERATFGLPEINVGRCGGGRFVGRLVSQGAMRLMFFTGRPIDAAEAYRIGLIEKVVAPAQLEATVRELAELIAGKSPLGLRLGKRSLNEAEVLAVHEGYALEQTYSTRLMATEDAREAARAVLEKRPPRFVGR
jgi:enoyl-CoA hydratase